MNKFMNDYIEKISLISSRGRGRRGISTDLEIHTHNSIHVKWASYTNNTEKWYLFKWELENV